MTFLDVMQDSHLYVWMALRYDIQVVQLMGHRF